MAFFGAIVAPLGVCRPPGFRLIYRPWISAASSRPGSGRLPALFLARHSGRHRGRHPGRHHGGTVDLRNYFVFCLLGSALLFPSRLVGFHRWLAGAGGVRGFFRSGLRSLGWRLCSSGGSMGDWPAPGSLRTRRSIGPDSSPQCPAGVIGLCGPRDRLAGL